MLIKSADSKDALLKILQNLIDHENVPTETKLSIKRELRSVAVGAATEKQAAFEIDFYFAPSKNLWVIHDLRIEINGRVAQIDHLLMNRAFEIYVLETKTYGSGVSINENGEFSTFYDGREVGIASPVEQNARHIAVLKEAFKSIDLPKRLGITMHPSFHSVVLVGPKAVIRRPDKLNLDASVIKLDQFSSWYHTKMDSLTWQDCVGIVKVCRSETINGIGEQLAALHKPIRIDYIAHFNVAKYLLSRNPAITPVADCASPSDVANIVPGVRPAYFCAACKVDIAAVVAKFCWNAKSRFGGKAYCRDCQATVPARSA